MEQIQDTPAWVALFFGLYSLSAGYGEIRASGGWVRMVGEWEESYALRFLTGLFCIFAGGVIFLAVPWVSGDWLAILINILGGLMLIEGMVILAAGERVIALARRLMGSAGTGWAGFSCLVGAGFILAAISRLQ